MKSPVEPSMVQPDRGRHDDAGDVATEAIIAGIVALHGISSAVLCGPPEATAPVVLRDQDVVHVANAADVDVTAADPDAPPTLVVVSASVAERELPQLIEALLDAPPSGKAILLIEGAGEPDRRERLDAVHIEAWTGVWQVDLDLLPARLLSEPGDRYRLSGGLGYVHLDTSRAAVRQDPRARGSYPSAHVMRRGRDAIATLDDGPPELPALREELREEHLLALRAAIDPVRLRTEAELRALEREHRRLLALYLSVVNSSSWRITAPLRSVVARLARSR